MAPHHCRLAFLAFNSGVAVLGSPTCAANPGCVAVGLTGGNCCPTDDGMQLACCATSPPTCAENPGCVAVGLTGYDSCCPTDDGMQLACCFAPSPPPPVPDPPVPAPQSLPPCTIDTHTHFADPSKLTYQDNWVDGAYYPENYRVDTASVGTAKQVVFMEASVLPELNVKEAAFAQAIADDQDSLAEKPGVKAVVAWANLSVGSAVKPVLRELKAAAPLLAGIRQSLSDEGVNPCMANSSFVEALRALVDEGLHFEMYTWQSDLRRKHYACVPGLLAKVPELRVVLINLGDAPVEPEVFDDWRKYITAMASRPNTVIKVGGLAVPDGQIAPYYGHVFNEFGYTRSVFSGQWFALGSTLAYTQMAHQVLNSLAFRGANASDVEAVFCSNAGRFYSSPIGEISV